MNLRSTAVQSAVKGWTFIKHTLISAAFNISLIREASVQFECLRGRYLQFHQTGRVKATRVYTAFNLCQQMCDINM